MSGMKRFFFFVKRGGENAMQTKMDQDGLF